MKRWSTRSLVVTAFGQLHFALMLVLGPGNAEAYTVNGGNGGNMDDPAFWGQSELDPNAEKGFKFQYVPSNPVTLGGDFTIAKFYAWSYFNGEFCFPEKTLTVTTECKIGEDAQMRLTGGTIKAGTIQVVSSKDNFSTWRKPVSLTVDGASVEAYASLEYGTAEQGTGGARIAITNGASWKGAFRIGDNTASHSNNVISVFGTDSRWEVPSGTTAYVGTGGASNLFLVAGGGMLLNAGTIGFGYDRGWKHGGGDMNALRIDNSVLASTNGILQTVGSSSNSIEVVNGSKAVVSDITLGLQVHYLGGRTHGNRLLVSGAGTEADVRNKIIVGYDNSDANEVCVEDGALLCATNNKNSLIRIGCYGNGQGNRMCIAFGATVRAFAVTMGGDGRATANRLELENGTLDCTYAVPDSSSTPSFATQNDSLGEIVIRGSNSVLKTSYLALANTTLLRFEIPDEGLAESHQADPVVFAGYVQVAPERIEVDVAKDCPKGKWLLYSWKDARAAESAADIASRVTISGGAADRACIVTEEKKVFLKVRGTDGLMLILR